MSNLRIARKAGNLSSKLERKSLLDGGCTVAFWRQFFRNVRWQISYLIGTSRNVCVEYKNIRIELAKDASKREKVHSHNRETKCYSIRDLRFPRWGRFFWVKSPCGMALATTSNWIRFAVVELTVTNTERLSMVRLWKFHSVTWRTKAESCLSVPWPLFNHSQNGTAGI